MGIKEYDDIFKLKAHLYLKEYLLCALPILCVGQPRPKQYYCLKYLYVVKPLTMIQVNTVWLNTVSVTQEDKG